MIVDTSALIAILLLEPEAERFTRTIAEARPRLISAANLFEAAIVIEGRLGPEAGGDLDNFVADVGLEIEPVTPEQVRIARYAYRTYGRGNHPAALNFATVSPTLWRRAPGFPSYSREATLPRPTSRLRSKTRRRRALIGRRRFAILRAGTGNRIEVQ